MTDCKNPHSISYQILLWTLFGYVLMYSRLIVFFSSVWRDAPNSKLVPYAAPMSLVSCCRYRVLY